MTQALTVGEVDQRVARNPLPEVQLPEVGRLRLGGPKLPNRPGTPLDFFRATAPIREDLEELARVYGDPQAIQPWDSPDGKQWQTVLTQAVIHVALPPYTDTLIGPRYETYNAGHYMTRQCDGGTCWVAIQPKRDGKQIVEPGRWEPRRCVCDPEEPECAQVTRLKVVVLGIPAHGVWRVECHGKYAARHWPAQVRMAQDLARDGRPVPATIRIESKTGRSAVFGKSLYKVPVLRLEEAFVLLPAGREPLAQIGDGTGQLVEPTTPPPSEPVPPEDEAIDGEPREVGETPNDEPPPEGEPLAGWEAVGYADAMANRAHYFKELSAFQKALGRKSKPDGFEDMTLGAIVQQAQQPAPTGAH